MRARRIRLILLAATALAGPASAADMSWTGNTDIFWNEASNWDLGVPTSADAAVFGASDTPMVMSVDPTDVGALRFLSAAPAYQIFVSADMTVANGIDNQSTTIQEILVSGGMFSLTGGTIAGPVTLSNSASVTFENASAGTATIDNQGQVFFEDGSSAGTARITNDGFAASTTFAGGSTAAEAAITNVNNGKLYFNDDATAGSATITNKAGTILFNDTSTAGSAILVNDASGPPGFRTIVFNDESSAGSASITTTSGSVNFYDTTTAEEATITANAGGAIRFQDSSSAGQATLIINNGGVLEIRLEATGDKARLVLNEGGTASIDDLTGPGTTLGSIEGKGTLELGEKELAVGGNDLTTVFDGAITGSGARFIKEGTGTLTLGGDSSAFGGETEVAGGTLIVDGKLGGPLNILANGRLGGSGEVGYTQVSGVVAPGVLKVNGNFTLDPGAVYEVTINGVEASRIDVGHKAGIPGSVLKVLAGSGPYQAGVPYTILTAGGGVYGEFAEVTSDFVFVDAAAIYYEYQVDLVLNRNDVGFAEVADTRNQRATANGVESLGEGHDAYDALLLLSLAQARDAMDQMSGEIHASIKSMLGEDSRFLRSAVMNRLQPAGGGEGGATVAAAYGDGSITPAADISVAQRNSSFWLSGFGAWGDWDGDGNAAAFDRSVGGTFVGADTLVGGWRIGLMGGLSYANFDADDRNSSGSADGYHIGLYGATEWQSFALRAGAAYSWNDIETKRKVTNPLVQDLEADYGAGTAQLFGELTYVADFGGLILSPFVQGAYVNLHTERFEETGGSLALTSESDSTDNFTTTLGLRPQIGFGLGEAQASFKGLVGWRHVIGDITPESTLAFAGGDSFDIAGVPVARDAAVLEAGLDVALSPDATLGLTYGGQFGSGASDQSVTGKLAIDF